MNHFWNRSLRHFSIATCSIAWARSFFDQLNRSVACNSRVQVGAWVSANLDQLWPDNLDLPMIGHARFQAVWSWKRAKAC
jgi:hypothetical protein